MAIICAECGEIHFDSGVAPTHCRKCEADLNQVAGFAPMLREFDEEKKAAKAAPKAAFKLGVGMLPAIVGASILLAAGIAFWVGWVRYDAAKETSATIVPVKGKMDPKFVRNDNTATYTVGGKDYFMYPGVRVPGTAFKVYYPPTNPADASEERPWMLMLLSTFAFLIGCLFTASGLLKMVLARAREADRRLATPPPV
jgi:hypothetical protein